MAELRRIEYEEAGPTPSWAWRNPAKTDEERRIEREIGEK